MSVQNIERTIKKAEFNLRIYFLCLTLSGVGAGFWLFHSFKKQLASIAVTQSHPNLIKGDYRSAMIEISLSVSSHFTYIRYISADGRESLTVPPLYKKPLLQSAFVIDAQPETFREKIGSIEFGLDLTFFVFVSIVAVLLSGFMMHFLSKRMRARLIADYNLSLSIEQKEAFNALATQVSHDIRSPLSALNMVIASLKDLPEEKRSIVKNAAQRINEIANDLLAKYKMPSQSKPFSGQALKQKNLLTPVKVADFLQELVLEKRASLPADSKIKITSSVQGDTKEAICLLDRKMYAQSLSNLINNSVEALNGAGEITVALRSSLRDIAVIISDTGKGIPEEILRRLGKEPISYGKQAGDSGSGIGVFNARANVENMGGTFSIQSKVDHGTIVTMTFPRVD